MKNDSERLNKIFEKTDGHCHICHKKLTLSNYGKHSANGNWEIEHSIAKANGGTNHLNNLYPSCIKCNREKGTYHTRTVRSWYGNTRAPYSKAKKEEIRTNNTIGGAVVGGVIGLVFGPVGSVICSFIGGAIGNSNSPQK